MTKVAIGYVPSCLGLEKAIERRARQAAMNGMLIEIPAQPANAALNQFVQVTGFQLLYSSNIVQGLSTVAVRGKFPPRVAFALMLVGISLMSYIVPLARRRRPC